MRITGIYAALTAILIVVLAVRVVLCRRSHGVGLGDGDDRTLRRCIRAHANAVEYVPVALVMLLILELDGTAVWILHACGISLVVARLAHAWGVSHHSGISFGRTLGAGLTFLLLLAMAALLLWRWLLF